MFRIGTFNLENLDDGSGPSPPPGRRAEVLRPQLLRMRADVLCLQEVNAQKEGGKHGPRRLTALDTLLADTPYADFHCAWTRRAGGEGVADRHNLVVLSRFPIETHEHPRHALVEAPRWRPASAEPALAEALELTWDRPILHCAMALPGGQRLHVVNLHLKAPIAAVVPGQKLEPFVWRTVGGWAEGFYMAAMKRSGQALEARLLVEQIFDAEPSALVAVCGDLNAGEEAVPVRILMGGDEDTGNGRLAGRALVALERSVPATRRFSVVHHGRPQMPDHMLVSRPLLAWYRDIEIHNEDLGDELVTPRHVRGPPESYHAPVVASFADPAAAPGDQD